MEKLVRLPLDSIFDSKSTRRHIIITQGKQQHREKRKDA
jgi:hypothetical protein